MSKTIAIILVILVLTVLALVSLKKEQRKASRPGMIKYVALGDSYTIGTNVAESDSWPAQLTSHLQETGVDVELMANPARNGYTSQDLIDRELAVVDRTEPEFVTVMIGTNDVARGWPLETFEQNFAQILDYLQALEFKPKILVVTTPDYSVTPTGANYGDPKETSATIKRFNQAMLDAAKKRQIPTVDIFSLTQKIADEPGLLSSDDLHPSKMGYAQWEALIYPEAYKLLQTDQSESRKQ